MPRRVQMTRQRGGWRGAHPDAVIVARPTRWGNPWRMGDPGTFWLPDWPVRDQSVGCAMCAQRAVNQYRTLITFGIAGIHGRFLPQALSEFGRAEVTDLLVRHWLQITRALPELRGKDLACWCPLDEPCHADVLLEIANDMPGRDG